MRHYPCYNYNDRFSTRTQTIPLQSSKHRLNIQNLLNVLSVVHVYFGRVQTPTRSHPSSHRLAYHGSNSWMMLSNRITAKSLELNPARQARKRMLNESKDCHPAGCVSPPDRPPFPPPPPAEPGRLFPCTEPPELLKALCLPSLAAWCSAISACGVG